MLFLQVFHKREIEFALKVSIKYQTKQKNDQTQSKRYHEFSPHVLENAWLHFNMKDPDITTCEDTKIVKEPSRNKR